MGVALRRAELERSMLPVYSLEVKPHEDNLPYLPSPQRAVFIMRALGMDDASISVAMSATVKQVQAL